MSCLPFRSSRVSSAQRHVNSNGPAETTSLLANDPNSETSYSSFPSVDHFVDNFPPSPPESAFGSRRRRSDATSSTDRLDWCPIYNSVSSQSIRLGSPKESSYNQFTTTDWLHDGINQSHQLKRLSSLPGLRGRSLRFIHSTEIWMMVIVIGALVALMAYTVDSIEPWLFDLKLGYCQTGWHRTQRSCCSDKQYCQQWISWGDAAALTGVGKQIFEYFVYTISTVMLASASCLLTMRVKLQIPPDFSPSQVDHDPNMFDSTRQQPEHGRNINTQSLTYPATGSGVAEVRVILSGFVVHGYLGMTTLLAKTAGLIMSVASGLAIGKEGPYVHIASAIANVVSRRSPNHADSTNREMIGAGAASGIAVAFGAPISGVFFALEEICYYFPRNMLVRTLSATVIAATCLRLLNGSDKTVLFQVHYSSEWHMFELVLFVLLGVAGGAMGAAFVKATRLWTRHIRSGTLLQRFPLGEVALIALLTGLSTFWNQYTRHRPDRLLYELSADCTTSKDSGSCASDSSFRYELSQLLFALVIKAVLTTVTFGIKVPAGIYIPPMILGVLLGRLVGTAVQHLMSDALLSGVSISASAVSGDYGAGVRIVPGLYALLTAAATMCGVTRLTITTVMIIFELIGSINYIIPVTVTVLAAKWTADSIEPLSIYDLVTETSQYPFLSNKTRPRNITGTLEDLVPSFHSHVCVDITDSPMVKASIIRARLASLHNAGESDGGLPLLRNHVVVGFLAGPDLARAIDHVVEKDHDEEISCLLSADERHDPVVDMPNIVDLRHIVNPAPICLDIGSSLEIVWECFAKLGLRQICVLKNGAFHGMVHKTEFVQHLRSLK